MALLAAFFLVLALNLSGLFEFRFSFAGGPSGHFLSGVLAVVVASPCTAPFMGAALGYAVFESGWRAFAVFTALGLGMALPYAALAAAPGWRRHLPKPGPWMPRLKRWLAVPLYATVIWLAWVLVQQVDAPGCAACGVGTLFGGEGRRAHRRGQAGVRRFHRRLVRHLPGERARGARARRRDAPRSATAA